MGPERLAIIIVLFAAAAVMCLLSIVTWKKRKMAGQAALYLCLVMLAAAIYNIGYALELSGDTLEHAMFWVRFQHIGIQGLAPAWVLFSLCVSNHEKVITPRRIAVLLIIPIGLFLAAQSLGSLNLMHPNPRMDTSGAFPTFTYDRSVFNWIAVVYYSACMLIGTAVFAGMLFLGTPFLRRQTVVYCVASLIPWSVSVPYNLGLTFRHLDPTPISFSLAGALFAWGFLRYRLLDIVPLARGVVFDAMADGVLVLDRSGRIVDFNRRLQEILPVVTKESVSQPVSAVLAACSDIVRLIEQDLSESATMSIAGAPADRYYQVHLTPLVDNHAQEIGRIITIHDNTETNRLLAEMERLATLDSLTGAYNRRHFVDKTMAEVYRLQRYGGALSLVMLDIDHFKDINDTYGHGAGDVALKGTADICRGMLRQSDVLGRFGGDEFVILLPETDAASARICAERLRVSLAHSRVNYEATSFSVTASVGVASVVYPSPVHVEDLFCCADMALYRAKEEGRNRVCACACPQGVSPEVAKEKVG